MDLTDFNSSHLCKSLGNISEEQESIFLLGDFNVNLSNYNEHNQTRVTSHSNALTDNNVIDSDIILGDMTVTISDHLPGFAIYLNMFGNISGNKSNIYERE